MTHLVVAIHLCDKWHAKHELFINKNNSPTDGLKDKIMSMKPRLQKRKGKQKSILY